MLYGYTFFSVDQIGEIYDDFVIAENLKEANRVHGKNYREATHSKSMLKRELVIRTSFPFVPGEEEEVRLGGENLDEEIVVSRLEHPLSRCLCCYDFFKSEEIIHVEPFGKNGFELVCELCLEENNLVPVVNKVTGGV